MAKYEEWLTEEGLLLLQGWARDGLTDEQIANNMGIATSTLYEWKKKYSEFSESLKKGKEVIDRQVENALLKRALGYSYTEVTKEDGVITREVIKEVTPDTTAQIFWLKNRKAKEWRDKQEIEHSGEMTNKQEIKHDLSKLDVKELKQLESLLTKSEGD
jgi:transposase-like protein